VSGHILFFEPRAACGSGFALIPAYGSQPPRRLSGVPKEPLFMRKKRFFLHFSDTFLTLFDVFLHFFAFFYSFLLFLPLFFLPILPIYPKRTFQSPFLAHQQGFALESAKISPQNPQFLKFFLKILRLNLYFIFLCVNFFAFSPQ